MDDRDEFYALHKFTLDYPGNLGLLTSPDLLVSALIQSNSRMKWFIAVVESADSVQ